MIKVGQRVEFDAFRYMSNSGGTRERLETTGIVVYVNKEHQWFSVIYGNPAARDSFKFSEIGKEVKVCG